MSTAEAIAPIPCAEPDSDKLPLPLHPLCTMFPRMSPEELQKLADNIRTNKLQDKIVIYENQVLDGGNRLLACLKYGIELTGADFVEWNGECGTPLAFVMAKNEHRRHMTQSQRAMIASHVKPLLEAEISAAKSERVRAQNLGHPRSERVAQDSNVGNFAHIENSGRNARDEAAKLLGVSPRYVTEAEQLQREAPELAEAVHRGEISLSKAKRQAKPKPPKGQCRLNGELIDDPPEIARQRAKGVIPPGAIPELTVPDQPTTLEIVREEAGERRAMKDDISDEEWLAKLPLMDVLTGKALEGFRENALLWRFYEPQMQQFGKLMGVVMKKLKQPGPHVWLLVNALKKPGPWEWDVCPPFDQGGCNGSGMFEGRQCKHCFGRGYRLP